MEGSPVSRSTPVIDLAETSVSTSRLQAMAESKGDKGVVGANESTVEAVPHDLKRKTARGALVSTFGQGSNFVLRVGSMVILARLLNPADFGLVGMVTACTGFLGLFRDAGLSMATVQRASINRVQTSTLFWINFAVGVLLAALCALAAPLLTRFYHEPRLLWVTVATGAGFVFNGVATQHRAMLQREMRFATLTAVDLISLLASIAVGIGMACLGLGYWALVGMALAAPAVGAIGVWAVGGWIPGPPRRGADVLSMIRYGGTVTLNTVVVYLAYNIDKVLLGRFWGAEVLGIYGRAYQLINLPTENLNSTIGQVAFPALSRLQNDPERLKSYFLKGYGLFLSLVMPITMGCALFAEDIVRVFLGAKWDAAVPVFRLLAPTIFTFALINPLAWLMMATNRAMRSLKIALLLAPVVILGYIAGLAYGPIGVATGFSMATVLLAVPVSIWATRDTPITPIDALKVVMRPLCSIVIGAGAAIAAWNFWIYSVNPPLLRLICANTVLFGTYLVVLCFVTDQRAVYLGLIREIGIWPLPRRRGAKEPVESGTVQPAD
jgi:O-antigen/teichoic acid export membrane protein